MNQTLLVELLTEELPPKALTKLADSFAGTIEKSLRQWYHIGLSIISEEQYDKQRVTRKSRG